MNLKDKFFLIIPMNKNNGVILVFEITPPCLVVFKCCHRATSPEWRDCSAATISVIITVSGMLQVPGT